MENSSNLHNFQFHENFEGGSAHTHVKVESNKEVSISPDLPVDFHSCSCQLLQPCQNSEGSDQAHLQLHCDSKEFQRSSGERSCNSAGERQIRSRSWSSANRGAAHQPCQREAVAVRGEVTGVLQNCQGGAADHHKPAESGGGTEKLRSQEAEDFISIAAVSTAASPQQLAGSRSLHCSDVRGSPGGEDPDPRAEGGGQRLVTRGGSRSPVGVRIDRQGLPTALPGSALTTPYQEPVDGVRPKRARVEDQEASSNLANRLLAWGHKKHL